MLTWIGLYELHGTNKRCKSISNSVQQKSSVKNWKVAKHCFELSCLSSYSFDQQSLCFTTRRNSNGELLQRTLIANKRDPYTQSGNPGNFSLLFGPGSTQMAFQPLKFRSKPPIGDSLTDAHNALISLAIVCGFNRTYPVELNALQVWLPNGESSNNRTV